MILDRFRLDGRVAIVTGSGRGLGEAISIAFAEAGADVVITSRTRSDLERVKTAVEKVGRRAEIVVADLSKDNPAVLVDAALARFGRLDTVVNNVGGTMPTPFMDTTPAALDQAFAFNVTAAHKLALAAVPALLQSEGGKSIINMTSTMGRLPGRAFLAYGTAKAAFAHYTRLAALDLSPKIRVNAIAPGSVLTSALQVVADDEKFRAELEQKTPLRRLGDPVDIAATALFLASDAGEFMTGKVLEPDGGLVLPNLELPIPDL